MIPVILHRGESIFKGEKFNSWRSVGSLRQAVRVHEMRGVDELCLLDISGQAPDLALIRDIAGEVFAPLAVGGGIRSLEHASELIHHGADKVVLNTGTHLDQPSLITAVARKFGSQAVVVSMDCQTAEVFTHSGARPTGKCAVDWAQEVERLGAGEILLNSIEKDGTLQGYDLDLIAAVSNAVSIPVVACGGAGKLSDFRDALDAGAHAVAAGAIFQFTDTTPRDVARYLKTQGYPVRIAA